MYPRIAKNIVEEALSDTRVVLISGPRQSGKTTLATEIAQDKMPFLSLDDPTTLNSALDDPVSFIRGLNRAVIDEIQRAPDLLLVIKRSVDIDTTTGRFLLTSSSNLRKIPKVADSLADRMQIVPLLPLSQSEIHGINSNFINRAFAAEIPIADHIVIGDSLIETVLSGGFPEVLGRKGWIRKQDWYNDYLKAIIQTDIKYIAQIEHLSIMPKLISALAKHSSQPVNYSKVGSSIGLNHVTTRNYFQILESVFQIRSLQPWYSNKLKRLAKSPKLHFLDSGLLSSLCKTTPDVLSMDKTPFGAILETFVFSELIQLASWSRQRCSFSHFQDRDGNEVDFVLENRNGSVVGIKVKSKAVVSSKDFSGMRKLASACGDNFIQGLVLYDSDQVVHFGNNMYAAPLSCLWSGS